MRISKLFKLNKNQAELDFVDVDPRKDTPVFVDPYALEIKDDQWSSLCADHIRSFFGAALAALRANDRKRAERLISQLHEARETFLGVSRGIPHGRGLGQFQSGQLLAALEASRAVATGILSDLAEAELFIAGIGRDKISDLTTNIIRGPLIEYTAAQCDLLGIPMKGNQSVGPVWEVDRERWVQKYQTLPIANGLPLILVPKYSVRKRLSLDSQEFYNHHMIEFLKEEQLSANSSLVYVLRSGARRVYKKDVKRRHPFIKDELAEFVRRHPEVLEEYKRLKGARGPLSGDELDEAFDERPFAVALIKALAKIEPGSEAATNYHDLMIGVLSFTLFPGLIYPVKEHEIHEGRKRIDIKYTNSGSPGFFKRALESPQMRAISVMVECKNYSRDLANPELDQMSSRFAHTRGFLGIICCRHIEKKDRFRKGCRDTAHDGRGYILALDDRDIKRMLELISDGKRNGIDRLLNDLLDELIR
jgi:hypothetical protein